MILSRRKLHFFSFIVLAFILPIVFLTGVFLQPEVTSAGSTIEPLFALSGSALANSASKGSLINSTDLTSATIQLKAETFESTGNEQVILDVAPAQIIQLPEPLLYWQSGNEAPTEIRNDTILLGTLSGNSRRSFALPQESLGIDGNLVIYSLVLQEIAETFPFPASMTNI